MTLPAPGRFLLGHPRRIWIIRAIVAALLALYAVLAFTAVAHKGVSYDEGEEVAIGYDIWLRHDFRMEAANGDLVKRWAALPFLISRPHFPPVTDPNWRQCAPYPLAFMFLFGSGNHAEDLLRQARAMQVLLGVATGLLIFLCSREIFGTMGGLVSLALFAFSPHMLAFGAIVSTEMPSCLTLLGSTWCIWHLLHRVTWARLAASLAWVGLLFLSKPSAFVIFPITGILVAVKLASRRPLDWRLLRTSLISSRARQAGIFAAFFCLHGLAAWGAIWADYEFRYAASPNPADPGIVFRSQGYVDPIAPVELRLLGWCRRVHFLPEGYLHGVQWLLGENDDRTAFMDGHWKIGGWRGFFPYAIWAKTPPALLLLLLGGFAAWWCGRRTAPPFHPAIPFAVLIAVYTAAAVAQNINIGHRHVLPIYPALYVLGGSAALLAASRLRWIQAAVPALLLWLIADSCAAYPDYLAYFSPVVGGPAQGYKRLVDSSLDWGMDLPGLKAWLNEHNPGDRHPFYLAYFGTGSPEYYHIRYRWLPSSPDWRPHQAISLEPGYYAISATLLESIGTRAFGPWSRAYERIYQSHLRTLLALQSDPVTKGPGAQLSPEDAADLDALCFARLCAWLRNQRPPGANIGHSILIWKLDAVDLHDALLGPPPEADDIRPK